MEKLLRFITTHKILISTLLFLSVLFLIFYPIKYISIDENQYIANSYRLLNGQIQEDCDKIYDYPGLHYSPTGMCVSKYNLGSSIILILATPFGEEYAFVIVFIAFMLSGVIFYNILKEIKINKYFVLLYLCYPPFIYFSRTLFSEIFSLLFINLFVLVFLKNKTGSFKLNIISGLVLGFATFIRYTNLLIFIGFLFRYLIKYRDLKRTVTIIAGSIPFGILIMLINQELYGSFLSTGYSLSGEEVFNFSNLLVNLPKYLGIFLILYPLMLVISIISKIKMKVEFLIPTTLIILLYSMYPFNFFEGKLSDLITAGRVLIPIVPFLMLPYLYFLNDKLNKWIKILITIGLIISTIIVTVAHQSYLESSQIDWKSPRDHYSLMMTEVGNI